MPAASDLNVSKNYPNMIGHKFSFTYNSPQINHMRPNKIPKKAPIFVASRVNFLKAFFSFNSPQVTLFSNFPIHLFFFFLFFFLSYLLFTTYFRKTTWASYSRLTLTRERYGVVSHVTHTSPIKTTSCHVTFRENMDEHTLSVMLSTSPSVNSKNDDS